MTPPVPILHVTSRLNVGGLARLVLAVGERLNPERFRFLLVTGRVGGAEGDLLQVEHRNHVPMVVVPELGRNPHPWQDVVAAWKLRAIIRRLRPRIVHTHAAKAGVLGRLMARSAGVPICVHSYHGHLFSGYFGPATSRGIVQIERMLGRLTDAVAVPSVTQQREIAEHYQIVASSRVHVIPYGVDTKFLGHRLDRAVCRAKFSIPVSGRVIGAVGRLAPVKNHQLLVESFARLASEAGFEDLHLLIVGGGECLAKIEAQVAALPLAGRVHFAGWLGDLREAYSAMDVLALTSRNEGMPVAVMEAMAAGVPVVSTVAGGVVDLITHERDGLLVPEAEPGAFAAALRRVLADPALGASLGAQARQLIHGRHSEEVHARSLEALYEQLLAARGHGGPQAAEG